MFTVCDHTRSFDVVFNYLNITYTTGLGSWLLISRLSARLVYNKSTQYASLLRWLFLSDSIFARTVGTLTHRIATAYEHRNVCSSSRAAIHEPTHTHSVQQMRAPVRGLLRQDRKHIVRYHLVYAQGNAYVGTILASAHHRMKSMHPDGELTSRHARPAKRFGK